MKLSFKAKNGRVVKVSEMDCLGETYKGICVECGTKRGDCEPDAREYECHKCKGRTVYGIPELCVMGRIH